MVVQHINYIQGGRSEWDIHQPTVTNLTMAVYLSTSNKHADVTKVRPVWFHAVSIYSYSTIKLWYFISAKKMFMILLKVRSCFHIHSSQAKVNTI